MSTLIKKTTDLSYAEEYRRTKPHIYPSLISWSCCEFLICFLKPKHTQKCHSCLYWERKEKISERVLSGAPSLNSGLDIDCPAVVSEIPPPSLLHFIPIIPLSPFLASLSLSSPLTYFSFLYLQIVRFNEREKHVSSPLYKVVKNSRKLTHAATF